MLVPTTHAQAITLDGRSGEDRDTCGISTPCKTISKAVAVAIASDKQASVHVAGGQLYQNECSQHGIAMLPNRSLNIEAFGGTPTIDCAGKGRFFLFGPPPTPPAPLAVQALALAAPTPTLSHNVAMNDDDDSSLEATPPQSTTGAGYTLALNGLRVINSRSGTSGGGAVRVVGVIYE